MTHTKDTALNLALKALELSAVTVDSFGVQKKTQEAITAIKQAVAAPTAQEPVDIDPLPRACNLAGVDYQTYLKIKSYMPVIPPAAPVPLTDDTRRLDALAKNSWDLRCFDMSDDDIGWRVIEHHMAKPHERTVAEVFRDDPRQAIDVAMRAAHGITAAPEKGQP